VKHTKFYNSVNSYEHSHAPSVEEIFEVTDEPPVSSVQHLFEGQEQLQMHYGPLDQKYLGTVLNDNKAVNILF